MKTFAVLLIITSFAGCSLAPLQNAGGTTDTGNARIAARIVTSDQRPLVDAPVNLYKVARVPDSSYSVDSTRTDSNGQCAFEKIEPGNYQIIARSRDSLHVAFSRQVEVPKNADTALGSLIATAASSVSGTTDMAYSDSITISAWVVGTPLHQALNASMEFSFVCMPAGTYEIAVVVTKAGSSPVVAGLDTVTLTDSTPLPQITVSRFTPLSSGIDSLVLSGFENGTSMNALGGFWWSCTDSGISPATPSRANAQFTIAPGFDGAGACAHLNVVFGAWEYTFAALGTWLGQTGQPFYRVYDFSKVSRITFWARSDSNPVDVELYSPLYGYSILERCTFTTTWTKYTLDVPAIISGWTPEKAAQWNAVKPFIASLQFTARRGTSTAATADVWIDNVVFSR